MHKRLGVNIDHVATLRQARGTVYPDPVVAAGIAEAAGAADERDEHDGDDRSASSDVHPFSPARLARAAFLERDLHRAAPLTQVTIT